ncbi:ATP-dependent DNA ligase [Streptomyces sp. TP-A0874]|uniref:ATP-dependent DNA ligase n=1 Tax=Streptomyces sp. TP-A0874 TaxID=549819 RepID=UPI000853EFFC|nr:DNA ligase [Streptomyces sp. TP-A0874]
MTDSPPPVTLRPPLGVMRPRSADEIPAPGSMSGGVQYTVKLDGFRALAFRLEGERVVLQSRSGRDLTRDFSEVAESLAEQLPPGAVLDGELCAYRDGRISFTELLRSHADRRRLGVPVSYIAFDLLAVPGRDLRALPLKDRWELLGTVLQESEPPLERVLATSDESTAHVWFRDMRTVGVEGIVAKALNSPYRKGPTWSWRKIRHFETRDGVLLAVFGPPKRPHGLLVELSDGRRVATSPRLTAVQSRQVAEVLVGRLGEQSTHPDHGAMTSLTEPLPVELRESPGRHEAARFVRVRSEG